MPTYVRCAGSFHARAAACELGGPRPAWRGGRRGHKAARNCAKRAPMRSRAQQGAARPSKAQQGPLIRVCTTLDWQMAVDKATLMLACILFVAATRAEDAQPVVALDGAPLVTSSGIRYWRARTNEHGVAAKWPVQVRALLARACVPHDACPFFMRVETSARPSVLQYMATRWRCNISS